MAIWIKSSERLPVPHQQILATIEQHGQLKVIPCWLTEDDQIILDQHPDTTSYSFSIVKAWQPFPEPYQEYQEYEESKTLEESKVV
jgi:hypothetical protein